MNTIFKSTTALACMLMFVSACSDDADIMPFERIHSVFKVNVVDDWNGQNSSRGITTRGALVTDTYTSFWSTFGLWSTSDAFIAANSQMEDDGNRNNNWTLSNGDITWPANDAEVTFFAIAPYKSTLYAGMSNSATPAFTYTTPANAVDQDDVMVAANVKAKASDPKVTLPFHHVMTAVKFKTAASISYRITKIAFNGIYTQNTFTLATGSDAAPGAWGTPSVTGDVSQVFDFAENQADTYITDDTAPVGTTFILLPQTAPAGAEVEVTFTDGVNSHTITADLSGKTWAMGHTYTYTITSSLIVTGQHRPAIEG